MSLLSKDIFDPIEKFFGGSSNPAVAQVSTAVTAVGDAVGAALPALAADAANSALAKAGPVAAGAEPLMDAFIEGVIALLLGSHSNPAAAKASIAAS